MANLLPYRGEPIPRLMEHYVAHSFSSDGEPSDSDSDSEGGV